MTTRPRSRKTMVVAGVMSGTSADGIDVALLRVSPGKVHPRLALLAHEGFPYPRALRKAVLGAMNASSTSTAELARLNWRLGIAYAEAVKETIKRHRAQIELIGCHGQTLYHQAAASAYLGRRFACTWQAGEAAVLVAELRVPVVSNFRPADMLAGGKGAPLVPMLDYVLFADAKRARVLQNIGGIANLTAIPAGGASGDVIAFDTGPGNMVMDALMQELYSRSYDRNGAIAARGSVLELILKYELRHPFYRLAPPRAAGREEFGREYAARFLAACRKVSSKPEDAIATATELTVRSIAGSYGKFAAPELGSGRVDYIVSGGGARNRTLMAGLRAQLEPQNCRVVTIDSFGIPSEAKEAAAFALLAWLTWHRMPGNVPAATGASRAAILGQVTYA